VPRTNPRKGTRAFQWLLRYNLVRAALKIYFIRQQTNFSTSLFKHATLCARLKTRRNSTSSELCPCIGPVPTRATEVPSSTARALLPVASGSYGLLCTSGFHRPLDLCEGRRPTKLEATKRHPVGHPELRSSWPTYFVAHPGSLSCDSPPALLDKLVPSSQLLKPVFSQVGGDGMRPRKHCEAPPRGPLPGGLAPPGQKRAGSAAPPLLLLARMIPIGPGWGSAVRPQICTQGLSQKKIGSADSPPPRCPPGPGFLSVARGRAA
jgi:hypothetical protein